MNVWIPLAVLVILSALAVACGGETDRPARIAFASARDGSWEIYVMEADGSNQTRLTDDNADDRNPVRSPDGDKIAFISLRDGNWEIYVMEADGSNQTRLTDNDASDRGPAWSPDGRKIAFISSRDGNWEIEVGCQ